MNKTVARWLTDIWYKDSLSGVFLLPLAAIFAGVVAARKFLYQHGILKSHSLPVPVVVIGNLTVGGTGKTPLLIWLARLLADAGYRPGIISRGYGGRSETWPQWVDKDSAVDCVGDEAKLIATATGCPMAVSPKRVEAANLLLKKSACNVILSDDGLQHYALNRTIECAVIDGERRFGNGYCLPAGPLREPVSRLETVDFVIVNGEKSEDREFSMQLDGDTAVNLTTGEQKKLSEFIGQPCHALAGIGNPERFFSMLKSAGLDCISHPFPDHYRFQPADIEFGDHYPVLMTEKDAVKCTKMANPRHWFVPVQAVPEPEFAIQLLNLLRDKHDR